ncbi:peptidylprolyl isomerase [Psychroserpens sp. MEBiC05023]
MKNYYIVISVFMMVLMLFGCNSKPDTTKKNTQNQIEKRHIVDMVTTHGTMTIELYNETPLHRDNFIKLIQDKAYDSLLFHRVIENFMIQGGDPESKHAEPETLLGEGDLDYVVAAEFRPELFHKKGALATAREESPSRGSSAMQFFLVQGKIFNDSLLDYAETRINSYLARHYVINDSAHKSLWDNFYKATEANNEDLTTILNDSINALADNYTSFVHYRIPEIHRKVYKTIGGTPHLDQNYTVFGQVIEGINIIDSIAAVKTNDMDRPLSDVRILSLHLKD